MGDAIKRRWFLYVPGMPFNGPSMTRQSLGGSETMGYYMAAGLAAAGHEVMVFCETPQECSLDGVDYAPIGPRSQQYPLGENWQTKVRTIPHDVTVAQRAPGVFNQAMASQMRFWWTHDLAQGRVKDVVMNGLWNCHGVLCVSEFHRQQVMKVYGLPERFVHVVRNGVDLDLFMGEVPAGEKLRGKLMVYSSRPERGLKYLVQPGGIMAQLAKTHPEITLAVCTYDYAVPELGSLYAELRNWAHALPNVTVISGRSKEGMAQLMRGAWLHVYPVLPPDQFEEVSCIAAMEAQAGGTPCLLPAWGALPETLGDGGVVWAAAESDEKYIASFTEEICALAEDPDQWRTLHEKALARAQAYDVFGPDGPAARVSDLASVTQREAAQRPARLVSHLLEHSDALAAEALLPAEAELDNRLRAKWAPYKAQLATLRDPAKLRAFYDDVAAREFAIGNRHQLGDVNFALSTHRAQMADTWLRTLAPGSRVLDYGCCVGQLTYAYAVRHPHLDFLGVDVSPANIEMGGAYLAEHPLPNLRLSSDIPSAAYDLVLATEVLEHQAEPHVLARWLEARCTQTGRVVITVPFGPHEIAGPHGDTREHVHNFTRYDVQRMFCHKPGFGWQSYNIDGPQMGQVRGEPVGGVMVTWCPSDDPVKPPALAERQVYEVPREEVSLCMIVKWDEVVLKRCLDLAAPIADEIIIGVDFRGAPKDEDGPAWRDGREYADIMFALSKSPLEQGFDAARNETVARATKEWVLWLDADERLLNPQQIVKYLRRTWVDAYAIPQHHLSTEPVGNMRTDMPCRLFRRDVGLKFFGLVHEHPCVSPSEAPRTAHLITDAWIEHTGYVTNEVRHARFRRNWPLIVRDREAYPDRSLGHMLWIRDLAHQIQYVQMQGGPVSESRRYAEMTLEEWRKLVKTRDLRLMQEALTYATMAADALHGPSAVRVQFGLGVWSHGVGFPVGMQGGPPLPTHSAAFASIDDAAEFLSVLNEKTLEMYRERYF